MLLSIKYYMSRLQIFRLVSLLSSFAIAIAPVQAQLLFAQANSSPSGEIKISPKAISKLVKELNLSADQIQKLGVLQNSDKSKLRASRQALRGAKQELAQLLQSSGNAVQIRQKRQQVQALQREVADANFETTLAIREILTSEQRVKLQQLIQQRRQNRGRLK